MRGLLICGIAMALSNLAFVLQAWAGADLGVLAVTVSIENVTTGMGTTAFVAYMSSLCNVAYTATQYALLTSLMAMGRTTLSAGAGWLAEQVDWPTFFVITTVAAVPGLLLLLLLMRRYPAVGGSRLNRHPHLLLPGETAYDGGRRAATAQSVATKTSRARLPLRRIDGPEKSAGRQERSL